MTEPVKRYYIMESAVVPMLDNQMTYTPLVNYKTDVHVVPLVMADDYARLEQECERLRVKLMTIASAEPARHNIEWAKAMAAECNNEVYAQWREAFGERNSALKQVEALRELLTRCQEHLDPHRDAALWSDVCAALGPKP